MAIGPVGVSLLYQRLGRTPPRAGEVRLVPPAMALVEAEYRKRLRSAVAQFYDHARDIARDAISTTQRHDAIDDYLTQLPAAWRNAVAANNVEGFLRRAGTTVAAGQGKYVETVARIPPARSHAERAAIEEFRQRNVELITKMGAEEIQRIANVIRPAQATGQRWEQLAPEIARVAGVSDRRAKLIARDQTNKFNSAVAQIKQRDAGITKYRWKCMSDNAVRGKPGGEYEDSQEDHWALNGRIFEWSNPPLIPGTTERAHPGERIQCRCLAVPVLDFGGDL